MSRPGEGAKEILAQFERSEDQKTRLILARAYRKGGDIDSRAVEN